MNRFERKRILAGKLDPTYEHPRAMRWLVRVALIYQRLYPEGIEELILADLPMLTMITRGDGRS